MAHSKKDLKRYLVELENRCSSFLTYVEKYAYIRGLDDEKFNTDTLGVLREDYKAIERLVMKNSGQSRDIPKILKHLENILNLVNYAKENTKFHLNTLDIDASAIRFWNPNIGQSMDDFLEYLYAKTTGVAIK